ncbi:MAG: phosphotransferase, partial [Pseudomonadota bacterium]|nr:phosphotransferase [Pseudomonadota bacterium]
TESGGLYLVDFDDCLMGPAIQDLWMFLSGDEQTRTQQLQSLIKGYQIFHDFNPCETALIEPLRTLRIIHYDAWLARRWDDPAFPINFPWFNTQRYWQDQILTLREQAALLNEPPLSL